MGNNIKKFNESWFSNLFGKKSDNDNNAYGGYYTDRRDIDNITPKPRHTGKLTLDTEFDTMDYEQCHIHVNEFLTKLKVPFEQKPRDNMISRSHYVSFEITDTEFDDAIVIQVGTGGGLSVNAYYLNIKAEMGGYLGQREGRKGGGGNKVQETSHMKTPKDIILFISKNMSTLINNNIFRKLNENEEYSKDYWSNPKQPEKTEEDKIVIRSFLKYINELDAWNETNKFLYIDEKRFDNEMASEEGEEFTDDITHSYTLFSSWNTELKENDYYPGGNLTMDEDIKYFCMGLYWDDNTTERDFHVYEDGEFREATNFEDSYLRGLDDEIYLGEQEDLCSLDYTDWKKNRNRTEKAMVKLNETINNINRKIMNFNKFIYNI
tara:strand:+ start:65419 stop:66552 length:1134 start_codon:yes stop_codon:yes gene_type:complete